MREEDIRLVERVLDADSAGYACIYPGDGGESREYMLATTPENIALLLDSHMGMADRIVITDMLDRVVLEAAGATIKGCSRLKLQADIMDQMIAIQTGAGKAGEALMVDKELAQVYFDEEDKRMCMGEVSML